MKVTADTLVATEKGLHVGLRLEWQDGGPVRFSEVIVGWERLSRNDRAVVLQAFNSLVDLTPEDAPLF